jgi:ABC-type bacteriocin/lantibiotic exporter with double-glycine peptidase domain
MDCGPACLKAVLEGFGIPVTYARLRESCQTEVDGTSIDALEETARQLGLDAEQVMVPADHIGVPQARCMPCLVVVRQPNDLTHFVVAWRRHGSWVQVMDPATGRRWERLQAFTNCLYSHSMPFRASDWREWAGGEEFLQPLRSRLSAIGITRRDAESMIEGVTHDPDWLPLARLDAAVRMMESLCRARGVSRSPRIRRILEKVMQLAASPSTREDEAIPARYWLVRPAPEECGKERLFFRGAVLVRFRGRISTPFDVAAAEENPLTVSARVRPNGHWRELWDLGLQSSGFLLGVCLPSFLIAVLAVLLEALLFQALLRAPDYLNLVGYRLAAYLLAALFFSTVLLLEFRLAGTLMETGRTIDALFRIKVSLQLPRLGDDYFHSRLISDMAERIHVAHYLRTLPDAAGRALRSGLELIVTTGAICWLGGSGVAVWALPAAAIIVLLPVLAQPVLTERELQVRTHGAALGRFYLDSMLGLVAVRAHGAEKSISCEHEGILADWMQACLSRLRTSVTVEIAQACVGFAAAIAILDRSALREAHVASMLLLAYWTLKLPISAEEFFAALRLFPIYRSVASRLMEITDAPTSVPASERNLSNEESGTESSGIRVTLENLSVRLGGQVVLHDVSLVVDSGSHVAVVGRSGAGKSTLMATLLGWHRPAGGQILVNGVPLEGSLLSWLHQRTAWIDPTVQLWNSTLAENLQYGMEDRDGKPLAEVVAGADLYSLLESLPEGLGSRLGEGGALVSGGEGQRVRIGRALSRQNVQFAILDEAFRGLDYDRRKQLLDRCRKQWALATLFCVTHDLESSLDFDQVLVVEDGTIVEYGPPDVLSRSPDSRYAQLMQASKSLKIDIEQCAAWKTYWLQNGKIQRVPTSRP